MEKLFKVVNHNAPIGYAYHEVIIKDGKVCDYIFLDLNPAYEKLTGFKYENVIGHRVTEIIPEIVNDNFDWISFFGSIALNGGSQKIEQYSNALNKWYSVYAYSPKNNYFAVYITDITDRKNDSTIYKSFFYSHPDLLCIINYNNTIQEINNSWVKYTLYSNDEIKNKLFIDICNGFSRKIADNAFLELRKLNNSEKIVSLEFCKKDKTILNVEWNFIIIDNLINGIGRIKA